MMLPSPVMLSVAVAAVSEPSRSRRKSTWCRMKPVWASSTITKLSMIAQNAVVRVAWRSVQTRVCTLAESDSLPIRGGRKLSPSCGRPIWRGSQTSTQAMIGRPTSRISAPIAGVATSRPQRSIRKPLMGESATPPSETPVEAVAIAQARRCRNQRAMIALTATPDDIPLPAASSA